MEDAPFPGDATDEPDRDSAPETEKARTSCRDAVVLGAGAVLAGGAIWWAVKRSQQNRRHAPGWPGATPHWNFSSKDGVGTALGIGGRAAGRVWFTIRDGAFTELFYPRPICLLCGASV